MKHKFKAYKDGGIYVAIGADGMGAGTVKVITKTKPRQFHYGAYGRKDEIHTAHREQTDKLTKDGKHTREMAMFYNNDGDAVFVYANIEQ